MIIRQRRIRNLDLHLPPEYKNRKLHFGIDHLDAFIHQVVRAGFPTDVPVGVQLLSTIIGPFSRFNAEGKHLVRRDLPMETVSRQVQWTWTEWHGQDQVEKSDIRDIPYKRYPRDFIPPPGIELRVQMTAEGQKAVMTEPLEYTDQNRERILHVINVVLEHFGECRIFTDDLVPVLRQTVRRLNWNILPAGEFPWERLKDKLDPFVKEITPGKRPVVIHRLEVISDAQPAFVAVGHAGFAGYVVFGFPQKNLYVLESMFYGNATVTPYIGLWTFVTSLATLWLPNVLWIAKVFAGP